MKRHSWTEEEISTTVKLRNDGMDFTDIAVYFGSKRTPSAYRTKHYYTVNRDPDKKYTPMWPISDKKDLYEFKTKTNMSWRQIANKMNRSLASVQQMYQKTDWTLFFNRHHSTNISAESKDIVDECYIDNLTKALIELSRHDLERLKKITKPFFLSNIIVVSKTLPITFTELKRKAIYELKDIGYSYPSSQQLGKGTYIIIGDSHGKHTRSGMVDLIKNLSDHVNSDKIIHVGHYIDDDNDGNFNWDNKIDNLCIIAKEEELRTLAKSDMPHEIIRKEIILGNDLVVQNQNLISDYMQTALSSGIKSEYFKDSIITNLHRHEFDTRCTPQNELAHVSSPGCMCEKHIVYTIKQQDFTDGRTVKQTFPTGYKKYRRMKHMYQTWQQGCIVVEVDDNGDSHVQMCRIHKTSKGFTTSYFDKIISEKGIHEPEKKTFIISDLHIDYHDSNVLNIEDQVVKEYKPTMVVNLGDTIENKPINHHVFKKIGCTHVDKSLLDQSAAANYIISKTYKWANNMILLLGNHERFAVDYTDKNPQFLEILNFEFLNGLSDMNIDVVDLKNLKEYGNAKYTHGELMMFGQRGSSKLDKLFKTFGINCVMGHVHYSSCRYDCYSIGLSGEMDLDYNEVNASKWSHGFGLCNTFEDAAFITNVLIFNNKTQIKNKLYKPINSTSWEVPSYTAKINYSFGE
jgi:hypothetical protein